MYRVCMCVHSTSETNWRVNQLKRKNGLVQLDRDMKDEMLRDRFVGIRAAKVLEILQMYTDLTLDKARKVIRQKEAVKEQTQQLHTADHKSLEEVRNPRPHWSKNAYNRNKHRSYT